MTMYRHYSFTDRICLGIDQAVRTLTNNIKTSGLTYPAKNIEEASLDAKQRKQSAALMRINHAGEICAQALYHGQGVVSRSHEVQEKMHQAMIEEGDHLMWCSQRLDELGSHPSFLNPVWYVGSFCIGMGAGIMGDKWSLGFVAETEKQVIKHLKSHLHILPQQDERSYKILLQMETDEAKHCEEALALGARELPKIIRKVMSILSKIMVKTTYWI